MPHSAQMSLYRETFMDGRNWVRDENVSANFPPTRRVYFTRGFLRFWKILFECGESGRIAKCCIRLEKIEILDKED